MRLSELKRLLDQHPAAGLGLMLPDGSAVAEHFHVTEVGRVRKDFMDCGGTLRRADACVLQVWVAHDVEHRLEAGKLGSIIALADGLFGSADLPVEVEYEVGVITQFEVASVNASDEVITLGLASKHTDCLAPDRCGIDGCGDEADCCEPNEQEQGGPEPQAGSVFSLGVQQDAPGGCC